MNEYIAQSNRIAFIQYTHEDDADMLACWQDHDTQKGYNYAFDGSLDNLSSIDITAFPFWVAVVDKASGAKIGVLRLSSGEEQDLAIWIYPSYRGLGYGTEAFSLAVDYIFRNMNLRKIYAGCYCDNKASLRMLEKVGFIRYPAGDQQEENCFTGMPTIQLSFEKGKVMEITRINTYEDNRFSQKGLLQHGCFLVDGIPYELEIISDDEAIIYGEDQAAYTEIIEEFRFYTPHITRFYDRGGKIVKKYPRVQLLTLHLDHIQPSQFFVDEDKIAAISSFIHKSQDIIIQVLPTEDRYISLDGHTRLYYAVMKGWECVRAVAEPSDDWVYKFAAEAQKRGIYAPKDMTLVSHDEYEEKWNRFCDDFFAGNGA